MPLSIPPGYTTVPMPRDERLAREELYQSVLRGLQLSGMGSPLPHSPRIRRAFADLWAVLCDEEDAGRF